MSSDDVGSTAVVVVSGFSEGAYKQGGLFTIANGDVQQCDDLDSTGLCYDEAGERWLRAVRLGADLDSAILEYSTLSGPASARIVGHVRDAHEIRVADGTVVVTDTHHNTIRRFNGVTSEQVLALPGEVDSWHLNGLWVTAGELFASAFHRGGTFRQWSRELHDAGFVFSVATGKIVADALTAPHSPRFIDGSWVVCNSAKKEIVAIDSGTRGAVSRRVVLSGWTRGLCFDENWIYVGESARRSEQDSGTGAVAVIDRHSWTLVDRIPLPCGEVFDLEIGTPESVRLIQGAFHNELVGHASASPLKTVGTMRDDARPASLEAQPMAISIAMTTPKEVRAGEIFDVLATVANTSSRPVESTLRHPISLACRWAGDGGSSPLTIESEEPLRTPLPRLEPKSSERVRVMVRAPVIAGRYRLRATAVLEFVRWLDDNTPPIMAEDEVIVLPSSQINGSG